ncbi:winged helix-turn-helix domain-containing protein [Sphaerotilus sp.]|uniref:winged helix-turn-helix domain-containing protein n=1 Tax=Sphaerotilus sp. TaxID=2093942 RepID=UPI002ACD45CA|nr:winged helix-turn-helix domain-containing protein [Sphaerotilus sp.]MDZ7855431.1 winged helix-turn-helix domain-containing protein [Sphaerotilus sp.]
MSVRTVLVVVEDVVERELLAAHFRFAGFLPVLAASAQEARRLAGEVRPDVVLIDLDAPGELSDGITHLLTHDIRRLRRGPIEIDVERHLVTVHQGGRTTPVELAPVELKLLQCLMARPEHAIERQQILDTVWGEGSDVDARTVDQNIKRLRRCLEDAGAGDVIRTVRGIGYRFSSSG